MKIEAKDQILGLHHITAMTSDAEKNYRFFTEVLGMRLVKKQSIKMIFIPIILTLLMIMEHQELQ